MSVGIIYHCLDKIKHHPYGNYANTFCKKYPNIFTESLVPSTIFSIDCLRKVCKLPITIFTDVPDKFRDTGCSIVRADRYFDSALDKLYAFCNTPYDTTILLDGDTQALCDPCEIIDPAYDFIACREVLSDPRNKVVLGYDHTYNTGVVVFKSNPIMKTFFANCYAYASRLHKEDKLKKHRRVENWKGGDQAMINHALANAKVYRDNIKIKTLPSKWNVRPVLNKYIKDKRILHQRGLHNPEYVAAILDRYTDWSHAFHTLLI